MSDLFAWNGIAFFFQSAYSVTSLPLISFHPSSVCMKALRCLEYTVQSVKDCNRSPLPLGQQSQTGVCFLAEAAVSILMKPPWPPTVGYDSFSVRISGGITVFASYYFEERKWKFGDSASWQDCLTSQPWCVHKVFRLSNEWEAILFLSFVLSSRPISSLCAGEA